MSDTNRKKLSELKLRYELEPTLDDLYVEGAYDKRIFDASHRHLDIFRPVYSIDSIEIPADLLDEFNLTAGNRQRVIALSRYLNLPVSSGVQFLIDTDMDRHLETLLEHPGLVYTIYSDLEGVFLSKNTVHQLLIDAGRINCLNWESLYLDMETIVKKLYSVRLAIAELQLNMSVPNFDKSMKILNHRIELDSADLVMKLTSQGYPRAQLETVLQAAHEWEAKISDQQARHAGRGHDYFLLLSWVVNRFGGNSKVAATLSEIAILLVPSVVDEIMHPVRTTPAAI